MPTRRPNYITIRTRLMLSRFALEQNTHLLTQLIAHFSSLDMGDIRNLRVFGPLFSSLESDFDGLSATFKNAFWKIGSEILDKTRKNTLFDEKADLANPDSDEDNIDITHATAEKLSILRPVLKPVLYSAMLKHVKKYCIEIFEQTIQSFYPEKRTATKKITQPVMEIDEEELPIWMRKFKDQGLKTEEKADPENKNANEEGAETKKADHNYMPAIEDVPKGPATKIKRRLKRADSDFDLTLKTWIHKNHVRNQLTEKAKNIFDFIIDDVKKNDMSLSSIISDTARFEYAWSKYIDPDTSSTFCILLVHP